MNDNAMQLHGQGQAMAMMPMKLITDRVNMVHNVMQTVMKENTHYGKVPGCGAKMVLLKPGADVLAMTFKLVPRYEITKTDLGNGHREYDVICSMYSANGELLGQGVGSGSTMEKKYRYRKSDSGAKIENEDIADTYNTVLKMSKKRAHVDATLTVTGAGDMFTQDLIEDDDEDTPKKQPVRMPRPQTQASQQSQHASDERGEYVEQGIIQDVSIKEGNKGGKAWKKWGVKMNNEFHGTFSETLGNLAVQLRESKELCEITWSASGEYRNLVSIDAVDASESVPK